MPNPIDTPRHPESACILRAIITTPLLAGVSTSTASSGTVSSWYYHTTEITHTTESTKHELRAYIQQRNNWTDNVYDSISWTAYLSASSILLTGNDVRGPKPLLRSNLSLSLHDNGTAVVILCRCDESGKDLLLIATCGSSRRAAALIGYTMVGRWVEVLQIM